MAKIVQGRDDNSAGFTSLDRFILFIQQLDVGAFGLKVIMIVIGVLQSKISRVHGAIGVLQLAPQASRQISRTGLSSTSEIV